MKYQLICRPRIKTNLNNKICYRIRLDLSSESDLSAESFEFYVTESTLTHLFRVHDRIRLHLSIHDTLLLYLQVKILKTFLSMEEKDRRPQHAN